MRTHRWMATLTVIGGLLAAGPSVAQASSAPYFTALPASGSTELQTARQSAVAAPLPDGQVLIAGGYNSTSGVLQSAELFNPASDTFTALPASGSTELQTARDGAVAAPLPDGRILIAGGQNGGYLQSAELFDPANDTFTALPASGSTQLQTARSDAVAAPLPNGEVLIAGGANSGGFLQSAELFNPSNDTFAALPASGSTELQTAREDAVAAPLPDGQVLIAGGYNGSFLRSAELFDPSNDTFTALPANGNTELQTARVAAVAAPLPDGQVLIAGGRAFFDLRSAELFDPANSTFTALPASGSTELQTAREGAISALLPNGQVLIAGGFERGPVYLQSAELYVPAPEAAVAGADFGDQTVGQPSAEQTLVLTNLGAQALTISGASLAAGDFSITADACSGRTLAFEQSCTITARFTPSTTGARSATIDLSDNEPTPSTIALSGTGVAANSGPAGQNGTSGTNGTNGTNGAQGPVGPAGPAGVQGKPGQIELVTCKTVTRTVKRHGKRRRVNRQVCTTKLISGTATFTTTIARATLSRAGVVYAAGVAHLSQLVLRECRPLRPGGYTLTLRHGPVATRQSITIA